MAVLGRTRIGSAGRLDLPDYLSIESFVAGDFKFLIQSFIGQNTPYILKGLDVIQPQDAIGSQTISIRTAEAVVYYPSSNAGSFFYGLQEGQPEADPLVPELRTNATNFVYAVFDTFDTALDSRAFWDPDLDGGAGGEFSQDVNTESVLKISVDVSISSFPEGAIPICRVVMGASSIESIQDCRNLLFRLGTGGAAPNPLNNFNFRNDPSSVFSRNEPSTIISSAVGANPFQGGDKNIFTMKEWMDVVMTRIKELGGTFFWYQGGGGGNDDAKDPNVIDLFLDSQGSTIVSKGEFIHDENLPGRAIWTEDVIYTSLIDPRNILIRASTIDINTDQHVAFIELRRDREINDVSGGAQWQNGQSFVNGPIGTFTNLQKGDWVKKGIDTSSEYRRVEEFYANTALTGGIASPTLAQSIRLSSAYTGTTSTDITVFTKGEYLDTDITVAARDSSTIADASGDMFWLAYRSDTVLGLQGITPTELSIDILDADGQRARCESAAHGLADGDRITIAGGTYDGTYKVEVETSNIFYIETTATGDDLARAGFYAIVETRARSTEWSFNLETAEHGFQNDQTIFIGDTATAYDDSYQINVRSSTTFQIPIPSLIADPGFIDGEIVRLVRLNVRTEFGTVKVVQGETTNIGDMDSANLLSFVGMSSLAQRKPVYSVPNNYNAINGYHNYNSSADDDLTVRTSKLTSMMADRIQDRGMFIRGRVGLRNTPNGADQDITATGNVIIHKPARPSQQIDLACSLPANSVAVAVIDRDGAANISLSIESVASSFLLEENKIIVFYRFNDATVYDWHGNAIRSNGTLNTDFPEDSQNRNIYIFNPGQVKLDISSNLLILDVKKIEQVSRVTVNSANTIAQSSYFIFNAAQNTTEYYVWYSIDSLGTDPVIAGKTGIEVVIDSLDDADTVALETSSQINAVAGVDVAALANANEVTITNNDVGRADLTADGLINTNFNFQTITVGFDPDIEVIVPGSQFKNIIDVDAINSLGTLTLEDGQSAWIRVNRFAEKIFNVTEFSDTSDSDINGAIYITDFEEIPIDQDVFVIWSRLGNNLRETHHSNKPDGNVYEETLRIVSTPPVGPSEIQGPLSAGAELQLPLDSRDNGNIQEYVVGSGQLEIFLNGQFLELNEDWNEVGVEGSLSKRVIINQPLANNDKLIFRIDAHGAVYFAASAGGGGSLQDSYDGGRFISVTSGQPIVITGPSGKLMSIQGDLDVTGVIDPAGITFTQEAFDPLGPDDYGIWRNASNQFIFKSGLNPAINLNSDFVRRDGSLNMLANLDLGNNRIINVSNPINPQDVVIKSYADDPDRLNALYINLVNNTGATINAGSVVMLSQSVAGEIILANANALSTSEAAVGVASENIDDGELGRIQIAGVATILNTTIFELGKRVFISTVSGRATTSPPALPGEVVFSIGYSTGTTTAVLWPQFNTVNENIYEERLLVVDGPTIDDREIEGPVSSGTEINLPPDSRDSDSLQEYIVGMGLLKIFLNGQLLELDVDYIEVGSVNDTSSSIEIQRSLSVDDVLIFRIELTGSAFFETEVSSGTISLQDAYSNNAVINISSGTPITINGPSSEKLLVINGDIEVTGVIDPAALQLTPQLSNPLPLNQAGIWVNANDQLMYQTGDGATAAKSLEDIVEDIAISQSASSSVKILLTNNTASTLIKATPVAVNSSGELAIIDISDENLSMSFLGLVDNNISDASAGNIVISGLIENIGAVGATGNVVYVSKTGGLTTTKPSIGINDFEAEDFVIKVGVLVKNQGDAQLIDIIVVPQIIGQL